MGPGEAAGDADRAFMRRTLELAERGRTRVHPNPMVGAVVVKRDRVAGEGWHEEFGGPHAEPRALAAAAAQARGATLYVNLEPCSHRGKTPPCTEAILSAGVARVVYGCRDPNPKAEGGADRLARAGIEVTGGVEEAASKRLNAPFLWMNSGTRESAGSGVFTQLKLAVSLDGGLAEPGRRTRVTGHEAQVWTHSLRGGCDAVVVGGRTATIDDPLLTVRAAAARRQPVRVVLDSSLALRPDSALVRSVDDAPLLVFHGGEAQSRRQALLDVGVRLFQVAPARTGRGLDLDEVWAVLAGEGIHSVLIEGGGRLATSAMNSGLVQRLHLLLAPRFLGEDATPAFTFQSARPTDEWVLADRTALGRDTALTFDHADLRRTLARC